MQSFSFTIDGLGLRTNKGALDAYPDDVDPYDHQMKMYDILTNEDEFVALNTAPTGSGKTWSWEIPCVTNEKHALVVFPTNALVEDQMQSVLEYKEKYTEGDELGVEAITGQTLRELMADHPGMTKGELITHLIHKGTTTYDSFILMTNPDVFTLLRRGLYSNSYAKTATNQFDTVVFDEFHLADTKGWNSLVWLIDEMYSDEYSNASQFVFLSATPEKLLYDRLENGVSIPNFHDCTTDRDAGERKPWSQVEGEDGWRAVMPPVDVEFRAGQRFNTADALLGDSVVLDDLVEFCLDGRTVVMLDGVDEVRRIYEELSRLLPAQTVHRIDGWEDQNVGQKLTEFDVLVSNSAVEVGIDFDVDQIVMTGYEKKSFMQRLGRLRNRGDTCRALCYVPRGVIDGFSNHLEQKVWPVLPKDAPVPRWKFEELVETPGLFPEPREPELFPSMYSSLEAWLHVQNKREQLTSDKRKDYLTDALKRLESHYYDPYDRDLDGDELMSLINKGNSPLNTKDDAFYDALSTYRQGGLDTLVYRKDADQLKTHSAFHLLRRGDVEFVTEREFLQRVPDAHQRDIHAKKGHSIGFCIYHGERPKQSDDDTGRQVALGATQVLRELVELDLEDREPVTIKGLEFRVDEAVPGLDVLNEEMANESFLCYALNGTSFRIQQEFNLDDFFFLYTLTDIRGTHSLALGLNALYLHCHVTKRLETQSPRDPMPL